MTGFCAPDIGPVSNTDPVMSMVDIAATSLARYFGGEVVQGYTSEGEF
jgi:hypothetical protein